MKAPPGFTVEEFVSGLSAPRMVRVAPNGDIFVVDVGGQILVLRTNDGAAKPTQNQVFAEGLDKPFGLAFYPAGAHPKWLYVANVNSVVRFPYQSGDLRPRGAPETVIAKLADTADGHVTRDIAFSNDGKHMFVSVGSGSDSAEGLTKKTQSEIRQWESAHGFGAVWDNETDRGDVLEFDPEGGHKKIFAAGIRNCVGLAVHPVSGDVWCSVSERESAGDERIADYATRVKPGSFFGWPWYYQGDNEDLRHKGERPDLAGKIALPDALFPPHSAALTMAFYEPRGSGAGVFPAAYRRDAFVALHGSINDGKLTGAKIVRLPVKNGVPSGEYEDFLTGFVVDDTHLWGRPVAIAVAHDGALLVTDDAGGRIWRVAYNGAK